jgi:hypothetical protein
MEDELDRVRRSVRFEVVPYTGSTDLVRRPAARPSVRIPVDPTP